MIVRPLCLSALAALALSACQDRTPEAPVVRATPTASQSANAAPVAPPTPPADGYVGRWAASTALCADGAWRFEPERLTTAGEVSCDIADVEQGAASWALDVACTAEGAQTPGRLTLVLLDAGDPNVMSVDGGPFDGPTTLRRCNA